MVLLQEWSFLQLLFLRIIDQENVFYDILKRKNAFLGYKNNKFKKSQKGLTHQNGHFSNFFFYKNIDPENVVNDSLER